MISQTAIKSAQKYVELLKKTYPIDKAYVFGSSVNNKNNESSDIDICIISPKFGQNYLEEEMKLIDTAIKVDSRLSPIPMNPSDLHDKWSQLANEINITGVQI